MTAQVPATECNQQTSADQAHIHGFNQILLLSQTWVTKFLCPHDASFCQKNRAQM